MNNYIDIDVNDLEGYTDNDILSLIEGVEKRIKECQEIINKQEGKYDECPEYDEKNKLEEILKGLNDELMIRGNTGNGEGSDGEPECDEGETESGSECQEDNDYLDCECPDDGDEDCNEEQTCWCDGGENEDTPEDGEEDKDEKPTESEKKIFKLSEALKQNDIIQEIKIIGWYTGADKNNVSEYTKNRCEVIKKWLSAKFNNVSIVIDYKYGGDEPKEIHSEDAVKSRRVDVYVIYEGDAIDKGPDSKKTEEKNATKAKNELYEYSTTDEGFSVYNEAEYFSTLSETNNVAYNEIKDKIKNFNPAFHSITPEGFAMRLNFLHGCTRQGPTLEGTNSDKVATNLAFGRPPVCVLRIGDFINTKMIIRTLSINYESGSGIQWDLNPEGAGIQPMFAKVQMGIDLIGGQSLDEPVRQLNNALNGLHYANSGVINGKKKSKKFIIVTDDMTVNEIDDIPTLMSQAEHDKLV